MGEKLYFLETDEDHQDLKEMVKDMDCTFLSGVLTEDEIIENCKDATILSTFIYSPVTKKVIDNLPRLKLVATRATGFDNIDIQHAKKKGIVVSNVPAYGFNTVAEHGFGLLLNLLRNITRAQAHLRETGKFFYKGFKGRDLKDKTLGIIGTGRIGLNMARIGKGFGMKVIAYDIILNHQAAKEIGYQYKSLDEVLAESDVISLHVPLLPSTYHLINEERLKKMKKGAILINTARGGLVDTDALLKAIDQGHLGGAGLDVVENETSLSSNHPLLNRDNVIVTPHIAFYTTEAMNRIARTTVENIHAFLRGEPQNVVNK